MAPRKKNPAIKSTGATSSKASPLPDWVKGGGPKPAPSYTKAAAAGSSSSDAPANGRPPPLFPPGTKTPINLLNERIQKNHSSAGWERPSIEPRRLSPASTPEGMKEAWTASVILTKRNKSDASKPYVVRFEPKKEGERFEVDSKEMARHYGATYALFRLYSGLSLNQVLPAGPREYWLDLAKFKSSAPASIAYYWAPEPFDAQLKIEAEREAAARQRAAEQEAREKGEMLPPGSGVNGGHVSKAWQGAKEVRMSAKLRELVEGAVKRAMMLYPDAHESGSDGSEGGSALSKAEEGQRSAALQKDLQRIGFRPGHARSAVRWVMLARSRRRSGAPSTSSEAALLASLERMTDKEAALEYLTIYTPEEDLPPTLRPNLKSDSFVTSSASGKGGDTLPLRWGEQRLTKAGFPRDAVKSAIDALSKEAIEVEAVESLAHDVLLRWLGGEDRDRIVNIVEQAMAFAELPAGEAEDLKRKRRDERMAVEAILGSERILAIDAEALSLSSRGGLVEDCFEVRIASQSQKGGKVLEEDVRLRICPGRLSRYPSPGSGGSSAELAIPTFVVASSTLPAYLKMALTQRLVKCFLDGDKEYADWRDMAEAGEGGLVLAMVEELEGCWKAMCDEPPELGDVMRGLVGAKEAAPQPEPEGAQAHTRPPPVKPRRGGGSPQARPLKRDAALDDRLIKARNAWRQSTAYDSMRRIRSSLPAAAAASNLLTALDKSRILIVAGETGCGKTTQVCQFILDAALDKGEGSLCSIVITQPRRISAMSVAARVAEERGEKVGAGSVGYAIRGERKAGKDCRILMTTTGVILRRLATGDPDLASLSHIIVDEVHERSVDGDFLLLELREVLKRNPKLKVIVMSATLNQASFAAYFDNAPFLEIPGRTFPVQDFYLEDVVRLTRFRPTQQPQRFVGGKGMTEKQTDALLENLSEQGLDTDDAEAVLSLSRSERIDYELLAAAVKLVSDRSADQEKAEGRDVGQGGILVFCPGVGEISAAIKAIQAVTSSTSMRIFALHANLSPDDQKSVFAPTPKGIRKCIVATNVAEASITIADVTAVIDTGRVKETRYDPESDLSRLTECWASRANAKQRKGRAGRTRPGECFKLYTRQAEERKMAAEQTPEMRRVPLESVLLQAKAMRSDMDVKEYLGKAMSPPTTASLDQALRALKDVGALELADGYRGKLTALGRHLSNLPLDLRLGKMLILGALFGSLNSMLTIAAILSCKPLFNAPFEKREEANKARAAFATGSSDLLTDANAFSKWARMRAERASNAEMREWCEGNYVSPSSLRDISSTRIDLCSQLASIGFIPSSYDANAAFRGGPPQALDKHNDVTNLLQSLILAGLWPSVVRIALPSATFDQGSSGTIQREASARSVRFFDKAIGRVFLHPASTLFASNSFSSSYLACFRKSAGAGAPTKAPAKDGESGPKVFMRDATEAPLYALLLFGGRLNVHHLKGGISIASQADLESGNEGWVKLKAPARIGALCSQLRRLLDAKLDEAFDDPQANAGGDGEAASASFSGADDAVTEAMRALISRDGLDPV